MSFLPRRPSRNPYVDHIPLDDTNDTIFLADSDDDDDDFFFEETTSSSGRGVSRSRTFVYEPAGEFRSLPDSQERIYVSKPWKKGQQQSSSEESFTGASTPDHDGLVLLIVLTNGLGIDSVNNQLLADAFAKEGFFVVMPDLFYSDPNAPITSAAPRYGSPGILTRVKSLAVSSTVGFKTDMWIARHTEERTWPLLVHMIDEIVDIYRPRDICVVGYSFGGKYALKLLQLPKPGSTNSPSRKGSEFYIQSTAPGFSNKLSADLSVSPLPLDPIRQVNLTNPFWSHLIRTGVCCHPSFADPKDFRNIQKPLLVLAVSKDPLFPADVITSAVKSLEADTIFHDVKMYDSRLPHGFAVKGDYPLDNRLITENQAAAQRDIVSWIRSFVA
ncbi:uncharacterized protein V1516DRAFT_648121 [Lipomyces oligophaga]|uniref:uncharacterized protein n=1 Tax=Lipomyces oligophaga TaxID=45792 RepID=UPI0034CEAC2C